MSAVFDVICSNLDMYKTELMSKLTDVRIDNTYCNISDPNAYYYAGQIINYVNAYDYYVNLSLDKCWARMFFEIDKYNKYRVIISLHHYGFDNSTFAIGAFLSKTIYKDNGQNNEKSGYIDIPLGLPPLTFSSLKPVEGLA